MHPLSGVPQRPSTTLHRVEGEANARGIPENIMKLQLQIVHTTYIITLQSLRERIVHYKRLLDKTN